MGAVAAPRPGYLPLADKELKSVRLALRREQLWRLDILPFGIAYCGIAAAALGLASTFQWHSFTLACYVMGFCALLHILAFLFTHWSPAFKAWVSTTPVSSLDAADCFFVVPAKYVGKPELVALERRTLREGLTETTEIGFEFRKQRFVVDPETSTVEKLKYPVQETFETYAKWTGHGNEVKALAAHDKYGLNRFEVPVPPFADLLQQHLMAPFFVFQVFCVVLWMLDEYWYYSLFTLFMLVSFECTVVGQRLRNLKELRSLQTPKQEVQVYRNGKWVVLPGESLLVGDIVSIGRPAGQSGASSGGAGHGVALPNAAEQKVVPADCLLLGGSCIVEEAVLTGESTPQWKVPISELPPKERLDLKLHKNQVLFSGTRILQHSQAAAAAAAAPGTQAGAAPRIRTPDGGCLAAVVRTGFETSQGQLMRTILFSSEHVSANSLEAGLFILFLLMFAIAASCYVLMHGLADPTRDRFKLILNCIMILTSVIPPELPMELSLAVNASLVALARKRVFCTEPFRIPFAGKVEVCCFDKTGTLTSDHLLLEDVVGPGAGTVTDLIMATCQSLVQIDGGDLVGDPLEKASLEACGWQYAHDSATSPDKARQASIVLRHHFNSNLKRMSAIVRCAEGGGAAGGKKQQSLEVVMKGAPEVVKQFLVDVPSHYDALYKSYAAQGARVIALASKTLPPDLDLPTLRAMSRDEVEGDVTWAGFAVFQCPLKDESEPALKALADASHQLIMITGDAPLTACFAASKVHIVTRDVLVLSHREENTGHTHGVDKAGPRVHHDSEYQWLSPDEATCIPFDRSLDALLDVAARHDLAVSGDALAYVESIGLAATLIPLCQVFARVSPEQKELVLLTLRAAGRVTLMCGDGTNDVGGLKAAHVGVALLTANEALERAMKLRATRKAEKAERAAAERGGGAATSSGRAGLSLPELLQAPGAAAVAKKGGLVMPELPQAPGATGVTKKGGLVLPALPPMPDAPDAAPNGSSSNGGSRSEAAGAATLPDRLAAAAAESGLRLTAVGTSGAPGGKGGQGSVMLERFAASGRPVPKSVERMARWLDDMEKQGNVNDMPLLKPGDASMASPFTAKASSVLPCTDIIKQGRCTLVTTVQMFKILGLLCLSTAYALSVMYLQGVKLSDSQATLNGLLTAGMFFFISQAKPLDKLSPSRPHASIFNAYFFLSLLGQFAVQLSVLVYMYRTALAEMPAEERLGTESEFKPNLVNSVCYLVEAAVHLSTFGVNYVGHPFNSSIYENKGMSMCLTYMFLFLGLLTFDAVPGLGSYFGLVPIPGHMRWQLVVLCLGAFAVNYLLEHTLRGLFPAAKPPAKGYMAHGKRLKALGLTGSRAVKAKAE